MEKDNAESCTFRSTELRPGTGAVFGTYEGPPGKHQKPLRTKLPDGTILIEEFPTGMSDEQRRHVAQKALQAVFANRPAFFKTPDGEPAE